MKSQKQPQFIYAFEEGDGKNRQQKDSRPLYASRLRLRRGRDCFVGCLLHLPFTFCGTGRFLL